MKIGGINMNTVKLRDKLELSRIVQGYWRLIDWNISDDELVKLIEESYEATEINLSRDQWFEIYVASRGIDIH